MYVVRACTHTHTHTYTRTHTHTFARTHIHTHTHTHAHTHTFFTTWATKYTLASYPNYSPTRGVSKHRRHQRLSSALCLRRLPQRGGASVKQLPLQRSGIGSIPLAPVQRRQRSPHGGAREDGMGGGLPQAATQLRPTYAQSQRPCRDVGERRSAGQEEEGGE